MKAIVVLSGDLPKKGFIAGIARSAKLMIAADGVAKKLIDMGIKPTIVVGDMDSLDKETLTSLPKSGIRVMTVPVEKDFTDGFFALEQAVRQGATDILLLGAFGGPRLDHAAANLLMLCAKDFDGVTITAMNERNSSSVVRKEMEIDGKSGDLVTLIPLGEAVTGIYTTGLKYSLANGTLKLGSTRGVSNVMTESRATVKIKSGLLLVSHYKGRA